MKRILITGKSGYIAQSLYNSLKDYYDITMIGRDDFDLTNNTAVWEFFTKFNKRYDVVIHTAVSGDNNSVDYSNVTDNVLMFDNLIRCRMYYDKLINLGSGAEFFQDDTPYSLSKKILSKLISSLPENYYNLRIYGIFDENELDTRFIKASLKRVIDKESIRVYQNKTMDFIYMKDFIKIIELYINSNEPLPKNIDCVYPGMKFELYGIAEKISKIIGNKTGRKPAVTVNFRIAQYYNKYVGTSNELIDSKIEYIGLEKGIEETYHKLLEKHAEN